MSQKLNDRERRALFAMSMCHYEFELVGKLGARVGWCCSAMRRRERARAKRGQVGYAITAVGRAALDASSCRTERQSPTARTRDLSGG